MADWAAKEIRGFRIQERHLDRAAQLALVEGVRGIARAAPFLVPVTRRGTEMSVRMTSAGAFGWITDRRGYRYEPKHPSGVDWPPIPARVLDIWRDLVPEARMPESCLVNWYRPEARMGMHQDRDEADMTQPVVSVSLGDDALFRIGNEERGGRTESVWLHSGDVVVMGGTARRRHHGIDRIKPGTSDLLDAPGRINLTLRVVT
ncbi:alpha-ketoglutarate-dependent dioxygenase AlkB [uncultured Jannaschia sp.]|uniref:alpha-ketoglutarate-dependent dioxygenase AlkB family protein n=1 Tax=uncultured Jannaschia sp. TaxID=293347 RepID=UPI00260BD5CB|nr:alpha-ketoglutarate-dependent dioxygenase AlkB [uncultured Jannaschia sp.]